MVFPTTGYLSMVLEAMMQALEYRDMDVSSVKSFDFHDVHLKSALVIPDNSRGIEVITSLRPTDFDGNAYHPNCYDFSITSVTASGSQDSFTEHARGRLEFNFEATGMTDFYAMLITCASGR